MNAGTYLSTNTGAVIQHDVNVGEPTRNKQLSLTVFSEGDSVFFSILIDKLSHFSSNL